MAEVDIEMVKARWQELLNHLANPETGPGKRVPFEAAVPMAIENGALVIFVVNEETANILEYYAEELLYPLFGPSATYGQTKPPFTDVRALVVPEWGMLLLRSLDQTSVSAR